MREKRSIVAAMAIIGLFGWRCVALAADLDLTSNADL
jgi:hypothetical protein